ncbi:Bet1-like protein [Pholiota conissans]|uniref:Bet1-like protein n=1 Tax=Pholiota conissans TaxID=109636 RepID=A0A9P6CU88_9AGAR|nr:Bet1-like protein [Pholiota conissans]
MPLFPARVQDFLNSPPTTTMSSSRGRVEDVYESQNDQRLDELHSKIRTLRGITTDIHSDVEAQNLMLDETGDRFSSFGNTLMQTSRKAGQAFGIGSGSLKPWRIAALIICVFLGFWFMSKIMRWWWGAPAV